MGKDVAKYEVTKGALHFAVDTPLPAALIRKLIRTRLRQIAEKPLAKRR